MASESTKPPPASIRTQPSKARQGAGGGVRPPAVNQKRQRNPSVSRATLPSIFVSLQENITLGLLS